MLVIAGTAEGAETAIEEGEEDDETAGAAETGMLVGMVGVARGRAAAPATCIDAEGADVGGADVGGADVGVAETGEGDGPEREEEGGGATVARVAAVAEEMACSDGAETPGMKGGNGGISGSNK